MNEPEIDPRQVVGINFLDKNNQVIDGCRLHGWGIHYPAATTIRLMRHSGEYIHLPISVVDESLTLVVDDVLGNCLDMFDYNLQIVPITCEKRYLQDIHYRIWIQGTRNGNTRSSGVQLYRHLPHTGPNYQ